MLLYHCRVAITMTVAISRFQDAMYDLYPYDKITYSYYTRTFQSSRCTRFGLMTHRHGIRGFDLACPPGNVRQYAFDVFFRFQKNAF